MPAAFCIGVPAAPKSPPLIAELPPGTGIFSITITSAFASRASMAAARPANPLPMTTTSVVVSHFLGSGAAAASALRGRASPPSAAPAATPVVWRNRRRAAEVVVYLSVFMCHLLVLHIGSHSRPAPIGRLDGSQRRAGPKAAERAPPSRLRGVRGLERNGRRLTSGQRNVAVWSGCRDGSERVRMRSIPTDPLSAPRDRAARTQPSFRLSSGRAAFAPS